MPAPTSHHAGLEVLLVRVHVLPEADQHGQVLAQCGGRLLRTREPRPAAEVVQARVVDPLTQRHLTLRPAVDKRQGNRSAHAAPPYPASCRRQEASW